MQIAVITLVNKLAQCDIITMDKGVYEFFIFEEKNLVYYCDQHAFDVKVDYDQLK